MEYTKQMHDARKAKVQALLDQLLVTAEANGLAAGENLVLTATTDDGGILEISHTIPFEPIRFFCLAWTKPEAKDADFLNMQYHAETRTVDDSAAFNEAGEYQGWGHIQVWHDHRGEEEADFMDWLRGAVQTSDGKWTLSPYAEAKVLPA